MNTPGLLILSSSFTDLAETMPPICLRVPEGIEVRVQNGNSYERNSEGESD